MFAYLELERIELPTDVADAENVDLCKLSQPLADLVNLNAPGPLFRGRPDANGRVQFRYCGYTVMMRSDGAVEPPDSGGK